MFGLGSGAGNSSLLPEYGEFYFQTVLAEYESLPPPGPDSDAVVQSARAIAEQIKKKPPENVTCADLFAFESAVARLQPVERVRRRICILRAKYCALFGQATYDGYLKCSAADLKGAAIPELRAELDTLLGEFHWYYSATKTRDAIFSDIRYRMFVPLLVYRTGQFAPLGVPWADGKQDYLKLVNARGRTGRPWSRNKKRTRLAFPLCA